MAAKKLLLVVNPISGKGIIRDSLLDVVAGFSAQGYAVTVFPTQKQGDATKKMSEAGDYSLVAISGGDGTLNEAVTGMVAYGHHTPIGYLPTGTTNDFAATLQIPKNPLGALGLCLTGNPVAIDIGQFNDRYFTYVAAFGAFTDVPYETPQPRKNILGSFAYLIEGLLKLPNIHPYECTIEYSGGEVVGDFIFGMVSNSDSVAGIRNAFGNHADLSDGLFEVTLIRNPRNLMDFQRILTDFLNHSYDPEYVTIFKADKICIRSEKGMKWTLDGEAGGYYEEARINLLAGRIQMIMGG
ncbi:MAG: YegS/Rv2252/BmrU family lipid kinase [Turicibacter sp.]|nr:YegS/Rv2252/BmrU family lipid kinase [Turicibacter sp.]